MKKPELVNDNFNWYGYVENPAPVHEMHRTHTILDTNKMIGTILGILIPRI